MFALAKMLRGGAALDLASVVSLAQSMGVSLVVSDLTEGEQVRAALRSVVAETSAPGAKVLSIEGKLKSGGTVRALLTMSC